MSSRAAAILRELESLGRESYRAILLRHGARPPCHGVKIAELEKIRKRVKADHELALELYATGVHDAQYLAGLIAEPARMSKPELRRWARAASRPLAGPIVAAVAAESPHGLALAREWIDSSRELIAAAGWATWSGLVAIKDDAALDAAELRALLERVRRTMHAAPDFVRYQMNGFVIAAGGCVRALTTVAKQIGTKLGPVHVDMRETACQVPFAPDYIRKMEQRGVIGRKRKSTRC